MENCEKFNKDQTNILTSQILKPREIVITSDKFLTPLAKMINVGILPRAYFFFSSSFEDCNECWVWGQPNQLFLKGCQGDL